MLQAEAKVAVLVARPDDETLWAGGTLLMEEGWTTSVGTLCRAGDEDRAPNFNRLLDRTGASGAMADLDDGPTQNPLGTKQVRATLRSLLPPGDPDLSITPAPKGEYTRHLRHEEVSRAVLEMWACVEIQRRLLTEIYGFVPDSWEVRTTSRREAFWRLLVQEDARAQLKIGRLGK